MSTAAHTRRTRRPSRRQVALRQALRTVQTRREFYATMAALWITMLIGINATDTATHYMLIACAAAGFIVALIDRTRRIRIHRRYR